MPKLQQSEESLRIEQLELELFQAQMTAMGLQEKFGLAELQRLVAEKKLGVCKNALTIISSISRDETVSQVATLFIKLIED